MKRILIYALLALLAMPTGASAQRRKVVASKKKVEAPVENPVFTRMLPATAKIVVADSLIVDTNAVLKAIPVNPEDGRLTTYVQFFNEQIGKNSRLFTKSDGTAFINEMGDKCIFSSYTGAQRGQRLFQTTLNAGTWSEPVELLGLDDDNELSDFDYPFLMSDGVTLYFAAQGGEGLGGYDIYRTRLDTEKGRYLKPENLGLPFNSEADDYLYVVDEQHQLAYFASARIKRTDSMCVYTFIPSETREILNTETMSPEKLRSMARLERIADTWGKGTERKKAMQRKQLLARQTGPHEAIGEFSFVINDLLTYTRLSQFRSAENRDRMRELISMQKQQEVLGISLEKARDYYATATVSERQQLRPEILNSERQYEQLSKDIKALEKEIRNTENQ